MNGLVPLSENSFGEAQSSCLYWVVVVVVSFEEKKCHLYMNIQSVICTAKAVFVDQCQYSVALGFSATFQAFLHLYNNKFKKTPQKNKQTKKMHVVHISCVCVCVGGVCVCICMCVYARIFVCVVCVCVLFSSHKDC